MRKNMERNSRLGFFAAVYSVIFVCGDSVANAGYFDKIAFRVIFVGIVFLFTLNATKTSTGLFR